MRNVRFGNHRLLIVTLALLLGFVFAVPEGLAAAGGNGKGKGNNKGNGGNNGSEVLEDQLSVNPDPCSTPGEYRVRGTGFNPGYTVKVYLKKQCDNGITYGFDWIWAGGADGSGNIDFTTTTQSCEGVYELYAVQPSITGADITAGTTFQVN